MRVSDNGHLRRTDISLPVYRCRSCDVFFLNPAPPPEVGRDYFAQAYADETPQNMYFSDSFKERVSNLRLDLLAKYAPETERLLDIGCGKGQFVRLARGRGWDAWGVELDEGACQYAREHFGLDTVLNGSLETPALPGTFDVITLWDVIEHVPDPVQLLRDAAERLRIGGTIVVRTANIRSWAFDKHRARWWAFGSDHRFYFSPHSLGLAMNRAGLRVLDVVDHELKERPDRRKKADISDTSLADGFRAVTQSPQKIAKVGRYGLNLARRFKGDWQYGEHYRTGIMTVVGVREAS
jgi:SAM-dependent methyltransferase